MTTETEARSDNTGFASGGVTCKPEALCPPQADVVLVYSFVLRNHPPERQAAKG